MRKLIILLFCLTTTLAWAGEFEISGAALYWKPFKAAFHYGRVEPTGSPTVENRRILSLNPDYDWGFRIKGSYSLCNTTLSLGWAHLHTSDSTKFHAGPGEVVNIGGFSTATSANASFKAKYDRVNLRAAYSCFQRCNFNLSLFAGAKYLYAERWLKVSGNNATNFQIDEYQEEFKGGGLELGSHVEYDIGCGFSFYGLFGGIAAIGDNRARNRNIDQFGSPIVNRTTGSTAACRPGLELQIELAYTYCCDCWSLRGAIGYEADYYFSLLTPYEESIIDRSSNIGFGGPYLSLALAF